MSDASEDLVTYGAMCLGTPWILVLALVFYIEGDLWESFAAFFLTVICVAIAINRYRTIARALRWVKYE